MNASVDADFLIYEEHSIYRRELLGRASSAEAACAQAEGYSRRNRRLISVRQRDAGSTVSTVFSAFLAGKMVNRESCEPGFARVDKPL
jgi:hypothetical protein